MRKTLKSGMLALLAAVPAAYGQDVIYNWTLSGGITGSGTLSVNSVYVDNDLNIGNFDAQSSEYDYQLDGVTGTISAGGTITGLSSSSIYQEALGVYASTPPSSVSSPDLLLNVNTLNGPVEITIYSGHYYNNSSDSFAVEIDSPYLYSQGESMSLNLAQVAPVPESPLNPGLVTAAALLLGWWNWRTVRAAQA